MEKILNALDEIKTINSKYELSNEAIDKNIEEIRQAKVCIPIIGKFSTGKSSIINTMLGYSKKLLKEDITPETAVPAEIYLNKNEMQDKIICVSDDGNNEIESLDEYRKFVFDANKVNHVQLSLRCRFLERIPDLMLVDMPGFESGFEIHNKAIDNYLPNSLSYIIAFSAEDMIIRDSIGNILKELCIHDMPLCIIITKCDKVTDEIIEENLKVLKEKIKKYVGNKEIKYCFTSSFKGDSKDLEQYLYDIQGQAQAILEKHHRTAVINATNNLENFLNMLIKNADLSESELDEKEEALTKELKDLDNCLSSEKEHFISQIGNCVEEIKMDVQTALQASESTFVNLLLNNQSISENINNIIRTSITNSIQKRFIPKVQKYVEKVAYSSNIETFAAMGLTGTGININTDEIGKKIVAASVAWAAAAIIGLPIIGALLVGAVTIISAISDKIQGSNKREAAKSQIRQKLNSEVFPAIIRQVDTSVSAELNKQVELLNKNIEEEVYTQRQMLEKAMADLKSKQVVERENKENSASEIKQYLEIIGEIKNEL